MSNIQLQIGGRSYSVACEDGQEQHIAMLGKSIDAKLESLGANARQNEPRALLFAALLLADELHEQKSRSPAAPAPAEPSPAPAIEALAERLEKLAESLEGQAQAT